MQELTVISGKGGTGKTSVTAAFAALAPGPLLIDCDVETPDLHLVLAPEREHAEDFVGGNAAFLRWDLCTGCGRCAALCRFDAIFPGGPPNRFAGQTYVVSGLLCEGCGLCAAICPVQAVQMVPAVVGEWTLSRTRCGPLVHARLQPGRGNSGKLVQHLRQTGRQWAQTHGHELIICDGVPGIGCPTIASLGGASLALIVVEPSVSGKHDFERVAALVRQFKVPGLLCVNRFDINEEMTVEIEHAAAKLGIKPIGRIPTDEAVVAAQVAGHSVVEVSDGPAATALRDLWARVERELHARARSVPASATQEE